MSTRAASALRRSPSKSHRTATPGRANAAGVETREHLLAIAERLFAEFGIDGVSIRQIAADAGLRNPAAVNYHFGNKEALVEAIIERHAKPINERRRAMLDALDAAGALTVRSVAEATVLPLATELESDGHYLGFLAQVARSRHHLLRAVDSPAFAAGTPKLIEAFGRVGAVPPGPLARARTAMSSTMLPTVLADYQRAIRAGEPDLTPLPLFVSFLVDLVVSMMTAELSPTTLSLLEEVEP